MATPVTLGISTAEQMRKVAQKAVSTVVIDSHARSIFARIQAEARNGKFELRDPFDGRRLSDDERAGLVKYFTGLGYVVKDHPDDDPGHPCSRPYTTLSWR